MLRQLLGRRRLAVVVLAVVVAGPLATAAFVFWRASHVRDQAAAEVAAQSAIPFRVVPIERTVPSFGEPISAAPGFRDIAEFQDRIAISASAGLFLYDKSGTLVPRISSRVGASARGTGRDGGRNRGGIGTAGAFHRHARRGAAGVQRSALPADSCRPTRACAMSPRCWSWARGAC